MTFPDSDPATLGSTGTQPVAAPATAGDPETADGVARSMRTGLGWSMLNNLLGRAGTFAAGIVLARILVPADYGVFAVALIVMNLLFSLNDAGMTAALIRWPGRIEEVARTAATVTLGISAVLYAGIYLSAPAFAAALGVPEATGVVRLISLTVLIDGLFAVPVAAVTRSFMQERRTAADLTNLTVSTVVSIVLALHGHGAWSLAWGRLAGNTVSGLMLFAMSPIRVWPGWHAPSARELLRTGIPLTGASLLVFAMMNVDNIIVGRALGPVALGFYAMAFNLSSWPVQMFAFAVRRVSLAGFSRLSGEPERLRSGFVRALTLLLAVSVPVCVLLATLASPAILTVYGSKWSLAAGPLVWLALLGIVRIFTELTFDYVIAWGRARVVFLLQLAWVLALVPALTAGALLGGIRGVAIAHLLVGLLIVVPAFGRELIRTGSSARRLLTALWRPAAGAVLAAAASLAIAPLFGPPVLQLLVAGSVAFGLYLIVVAPLRRLARVS